MGGSFWATFEFLKHPNGENENGLGDLNFKDLESFEIRLNTCEIYEFWNCEKKNKLLSEIKGHKKEEELVWQFFWHMNMSR